MNQKPPRRVASAILFSLSCGLAATAACSSSTATTETSSTATTMVATSGSGGRGGAGPATTSATSTTGNGGSGGPGGASPGGAGGTGLDAGVPPNDGGPTCSAETPAETAACGAGKSCHLASCGPPPQYACYQAGTVVAGAACTNSVDCSSGLTCIGYSATLAVCEKQCATDGDCASAHCLGYTTCSQASSGRLCVRPCSDPTAAGAASCGTGFKCDGACFGQASSTICVPAGTATAGPCTGSSGCAAGYTCLNRAVDGGFAGACTQTCRTNTDCAAGMCTGNFSCAGIANGLHFCQ